MKTSADLRYIVTGFQPFSTFDTNPSWNAAQALAKALGENARAHLLPVTYTTASQFARAHLQATRYLPLYFIHLGLGANRDEVCFELRAKNLRDHRPDNLERTLPIELPQQNSLVKDDRPHRLCPLDLQAAVHTYNSNLKDSALPKARISEDCGTYVCNALLFHTLRACEEARAQGQKAQGLFIHIPMLSPDHARELGEHLARALPSPHPRAAHVT